MSMSGPFRHILLGFRGAIFRPGLVILHGALDLLGTITSLLPALLALTLLAGALVRTVPLVLLSWDPGLFGQALLARVTSGSFLWPVLGLALSGALLTGVLRVFFLSGALGVLAEDMKGESERTTFMDNALARFPSGLGAGVLILLVGLLWVGWSMGVLWSASIIYAWSLDGSATAGAGGAAALAFSTAALVLSAIAFEIVTRLTLIRVLVLGEGPAVAVFEAVSLVLRRLGAVIVLVLIFALVQIVVSVALFAMTAPMSLASLEAAGSGWTTAARVVAWIIRALALALPALAAYGAYSALVLDDAGALPAPRPPEGERAGIPPATDEPMAIARPVEPVVVAVPVVPARPIEE